MGKKFLVAMFMALVPTGLPSAVTHAEAAPFQPACSWQTAVVPGPRDLAIEGVASLSTSDAWAVGWVFAGAQVLRWDGSRWTRMEVPPREADELMKVSASSPSNVWAVGWEENHGHSLTMHSNGGAWRVVPSPNLLSISENNQLTAVVTLAPDDVWAVGRAYPEPPRNRYSSLILHWDGKRWTIRFHRLDEFLYAITARGNELWSVGWKLGNDGLVHALALHFDGRNWRELAIPRMRYRASSLLDVTVTPSGEVWAIGDTNTAPSTHDTSEKGNFQTLAFRIVGERVTPDRDGLLAAYKDEGAGAGEAGELGIAAVPKGGLLAFDDSKGMYRRDGLGWHPVPLPARGGMYLADLASGRNGPTWLAADARRRPILARYVCG